MMNKILVMVFSAVIAAALVVSAVAYFSGGGADEPPVADDGPNLDAPPAADPRTPIGPVISVVLAPEQAQAERPSVFPDPQANWIQLPEGTNLAEGKPVSSGEVTEVYAAANVVDGDTNTYWESKGVPAELTIDLGASYNVQTVGIRLNPAPIWEPRNQTVEVQLSEDGSSFAVAAPETRYDFDPDTGNIARIDFSATPARYVRLVFTAKSSGRSNGGQAAEIVVYE